LAEIRDIIEGLGGKEKVEGALRNNLAWIVKSFKVNKNLGSSGTRSVRGAWGPVYPETTGYLVSTLLAAAKYFEDEKLKALALQQLDFFKSIQNEDGSFHQSPTVTEPIVFDTAQIILGLLSITPELEAPKAVMNMIIKAVDWLGLQLDKEGNFTDHNYVDNYNPSYYSRIAWPMASAELIKYSKPRTKTKKLIARLAELQTTNRYFEPMGFSPEQDPYTHNIAYTLRGLWECAEIINDRKLKKKVRTSAHVLNEVILTEGKVGGSYDKDWKGDYSYQCSVGNAQLALLNMILYERSGHKENLDVVLLLLKPLFKKQGKVLLNSGAIPSSIPISGQYQRYKYTNWTQKFFSDALLKLLSFGN